MTFGQDHYTSFIDNDFVKFHNTIQITNEKSKAGQILATCAP